MLPTLEAGDGSLIHKVVPASDGEAWYIHFVEVQRTVFGFPIVVISWMPEPLRDQTLVVFGVSGDSVHPFETIWSSCSTDSIAFLKKTQSCVPHVLTHEMWRLRDGQIVLSVTFEERQSGDTDKA